MANSTQKFSTFAEAMASQPKGFAEYPGFSTVQYTPSVGLSRRPKTVTVLLYKGQEVTRGNMGDIKALLQHEPTRAGWIARVTAP